MNVNIEKNKYYVTFTLDRCRPRAVTRCRIFFLPSGAGPVSIGCGETLQSKKDVFNSVTGCRFALKRALRAANLNKPARTAFWKEFNRHHRLRPDIVTCREAFGNAGGTFEGLPKTFFDVTGPFDNRLRAYKHPAWGMTFTADETIMPRGRAVAKWWGETDIDRLTRADAEVKAEIPGRELFNKLDRDYCDNCEEHTVFLEGPRGGSCLNIKCKFCGQKYWLDPMTRTAKKL